MHLEILNKQQLELLPFINFYKKKFYMVGGTAIALHIGHRLSVDFDMFTFDEINPTNIKKRVINSGFKSYLIKSHFDQIHFILNDVKLTFFNFPYNLNAEILVENKFRIPDLLTLAAIKAFALGGRGKWKDYVDLYFILKEKYTLTEIENKALELFTPMFNPILFRKQICFFEDINYTEEVEYIPGYEVDEQTVKKFLTEIALEEF